MARRSEAIAELAFRTADDGRTYFRPFMPLSAGVRGSMSEFREFLVPDGAQHRALRRRWGLLCRIDALLLPHAHLAAVALVLLLALLDPGLKARSIWVGQALGLVGRLPLIVVYLAEILALMAITGSLPIHGPRPEPLPLRAKVAAASSRRRLGIERLWLAGLVLLFAGLLAALPGPLTDQHKLLAFLGLSFAVAHLISVSELSAVRKLQQDGDQ